MDENTVMPIPCFQLLFVEQHEKPDGILLRR